jgi:hypothetical protein
MRRFVNFDGDKPEMRDEEVIQYHLPNVEASFESDPTRILGNVDIFLTNFRLILVGSSFAYDFDIPVIGLFAVSRDPQSYYKPCLYCQIEQLDESDPDELFLAPEDETTLKTLFDEFARSAEQNPDPPEDGEEDWEGEDELIYNVDEVNLGAQQAAILAQFESKFIAPEDQFEDAENDEQEYYEEANENEGAILKESEYEENSTNQSL